MMIKRFVFSLLLLLVSEVVFCQVIAMQNDMNNTLYVGVPNHITVAVEGCKSNSIVLSTNEGEIKVDSFSAPGHYCFWFGKPCMAKIYVNKKLKNGRLRLIDSVFFRVKRLPLPKAKLAGKSGGEISQSELLVQVAPAATFYFSGICGRYPITNFTIVVQRNHKEIFKRTMGSPEGTRIDSVTHEFFYRLKDNDKVIFKDIQIRDMVSLSCDLDPLDFTINDAHKYRKLRVADTTIETDAITGQEMQVITSYRKIN